MTEKKIKTFFAYCKFCSGEFSDFFYKEFITETEKDAIIDFASYAKDIDPNKAQQFIIEKLNKEEWTADYFWQNMNTHFFSPDGCKSFELRNMKHIEF